MSRLLAIVRRAARLPGLRRLTGIGPLLRLSFALRAGLVHERLRFAARELAGRTTAPAVYTRPGGVALAIRHRTPDVLVLDELFSQGEYEPPAAAVPVLGALPADARVVDLGANIGLFGVWVLERFPGAAIVALEPDPANAAVHRRAIAANAREGNWVLHEAAAAVRDGSTRFEPGGYSTSGSLAHGTIEVPTLDVLPLLADADLAKIDVEGAEWEILTDPRLGSTGPVVIVVECHPHQCPAEDPRAAGAALLAEAGYRVIEGRSDVTHGTSTLWGLRARGAATGG